MYTGDMWHSISHLDVDNGCVIRMNQIRGVSCRYLTVGVLMRTKTTTMILR